MGKPSYKELEKRLKKLEKTETKRKGVEEAVKHRMELIELISVISTTFINLTPEETDVEIVNALELVSGFFNVERGYICLFPDDKKKMEITHEWSDNKVKTKIKKSKKYTYPNTAKKKITFR